MTTEDQDKDSGGIQNSTAETKKTRENASGIRKSEMVIISKEEQQIHPSS